MSSRAILLPNPGVLECLAVGWERSTLFLMSTSAAPLLLDKPSIVMSSRLARWTSGAYGMDTEDPGSLKSQEGRREMV